MIGMDILTERDILRVLPERLFHFTCNTTPLAKTYAAQFEGFSVRYACKPICCPNFPFHETGVKTHMGIMAIRASKIEGKNHHW